MNPREEIVSAMARAFYVSAYADFMDRDFDSEEAAHVTQEQFDAERRGLPRPGGGQDWMDHAPPTSTEAWGAAWSLAKRIEAATGESLELHYNRACRVCFQTKGGRCGGHDAPEFGHYLAMEAMGHGVAWSDDHTDHPFDVPDVESLLICSRAEALAGTEET